MVGSLLAQGFYHFNLGFSIYLAAMEFPSKFLSYPRNSDKINRDRPSAVADSWFRKRKKSRGIGADVATTAAAAAAAAAARSVAITSLLPRRR